MSWVEVLDASRFWIEGIAIPSVGSFGILGNLVVIAVLLGPTYRTENINQKNLDLA